MSLLSNYVFSHNDTLILNNKDRIVGEIKGMIKGVLIVQSTLHDTIEQRDVEQALERNWSIRKDIIVKVEGATVRLSGIVSSLYKKEEAGHIASKAPGITLVDNRLIIHFNYKKNNLKN